MSELFCGLGLHAILSSSPPWQVGISQLSTQYPHLTQNPPITALLCILSQMHPLQNHHQNLSAPGRSQQKLQTPGNILNSPHHTTTSSALTKPHPLLYHRLPPISTPFPPLDSQLSPPASNGECFSPVLSSSPTPFFR